MSVTAQMYVALQDLANGRSPSLVPLRTRSALERAGLVDNQHRVTGAGYAYLGMPEPSASVSVAPGYSAGHSGEHGSLGPPDDRPWSLFRQRAQRILDANRELKFIETSGHPRSGDQLNFLNRVASGKASFTDNVVRYMDDLWDNKYGDVTLYHEECKKNQERP